MSASPDTDVGDTRSYAGALLFGDTLACDELRPAAFVPGVVDVARLRAHTVNAEALLRALAVVEDGVRAEEPEPSTDNTLHRLEAKLDLLTAVVAAIVPVHEVDTPRALHWSARGACLHVDTEVMTGTPGLFRVQPVDWLPSLLVLPATVLAGAAAATGGRMVWLRFDSLSPALEAALERHLFRIHRRAVAETRRR